MDASLSKNKCLWSWLSSEKELGVETKTTWGWLSYVNAVLNPVFKMYRNVNKFGYNSYRFISKIANLLKRYKRNHSVLYFKCRKNIKGVPFFSSQGNLDISHWISIICLLFIERETQLTSNIFPEDFKFNFFLTWYL